MKKISALSLLLPLALSSMAAAQTKTFTIVGEKLAYRNLATIENQSEFETFTGKTNGVTGDIEFNPATRAGGGTITVDAKAIETGIPLRDEHMKSPMFLDAAKYPTIVFKTSKIHKMAGDAYKVDGLLTLHGVTKKVTASVRVKYRAAGDATKAAGFDGDVLQVTSRLPILLSDFNIVVPAQAAGKVSNEVTLTVSAYAVAH